MSNVSSVMLRKQLRFELYKAGFVLAASYLMISGRESIETLQNKISRIRHYNNGRK